MPHIPSADKVFTRLVEAEKKIANIEEAAKPKPKKRSRKKK
jgi:hypothetical protein